MPRRGQRGPRRAAQMRSWLKVTDIRQVLSRERTRNIAGAVAVAALVAVIIQQSWNRLPVTGSSILSFLITGVALGSIYGVAAQGLVVTYATSGVFNFAQGAIGMFLAFVYWEFRVDIGLPTVVGILLTVLVAAPLMGVLIERGIMRFVTGSPIVAQLVVTIGLMLALMGLAASVWNPSSRGWHAAAPGSRARRQSAAGRCRSAARWSPARPRTGWTRYGRPRPARGSCRRGTPPGPCR